MKITWRSLLPVSFFTLCVNQLFSLQVGAGTLLWQYQSSFEAGFDLTLKDQRKIAGFELQSEFHFPLALPVEGLPYTYGLDALTKTESLTIVQNLVKDRRNLSSVMQRLWLVSDRFSIGIRRFESFTDSNSMLILGNPLYDPGLPFISSQAMIENQSGGIYKSAISHSSMTIMKYSFTPFKGSPVYLLQEMAIRPMIYIDFLYQNTPQNYGGGLEIKTGGMRRVNWSIGFLLSSFYAKHKDSNIFQSSIGAWFSFFDFGSEIGLLVKNRNHPGSVFMSSLYASRAEVSVKESDSMQGGLYLGLGPKSGEKQGISTRLYFYANPHFSSVFAYYFYSLDEVEVRFGYQKDQIRELADLNLNNNLNSYLALEVDTNLIEDRFILKVQARYSWYYGSLLRSEVSLVFYF